MSSRHHYRHEVGRADQDDISRVSERIRAAVDRGTLEAGGVKQTHVGIHFNEWQFPINEFDDENGHWVSKIKASPFVGEIDFDRRSWARSREAVDGVLDLIQKEIRKDAADRYPGLRIDSYIRQGSSRDGLKVVSPDEFDTILEFHFEGLEGRLVQEDVYKGSKVVPGLCLMAVKGVSFEGLRVRYPKLVDAGVFQTHNNGHIILNSRRLYEAVFVSMIDRACDRIVEMISNSQQSGRQPGFSITRKTNAPSINIVIHLDDTSHQVFMRHGAPRNADSLVKEIDVDIVPGILLAYDETTQYEGKLLNCPIHAVCKWSEPEQARALEFVDTNIIWNVKTLGYEKHIIDVARQVRRKRLILTALRVIKTYFVRTKKIAKDAGHGPPYIASVLKSYHLKQIAFYLMFYLCNKYPGFRLDGIQKAVVYFINAMGVALDKRRLPHFFYSNTNIQTMLPGYPAPTNPTFRHNLFRGISTESLRQARQSLDGQLSPDLGIGRGGGDEEQNRVINEFTASISTGDYY